MNKITRILVLIMLVQLPLMTYAQQVREEMLKKGKEHMPGYSIKIKHGKSITRKTMKETLAQAGLKKASHKKGYYVYKGAVLPAISTNKQDYYYKVTGNKRKATLRMAVSKGYDNYVTSANDATTATGITAFLTDVENKVTINQQINDKQAELKNIEKQEAKAAKAKAKKQGEIDKLKTQGSK